MKNIIKKWWFYLILIIIIVIVIALQNSGGVGSAGISKEEFEKIKIGMDQFEVSSIIDNNHEWNDDNTYKKCVEKIEELKSNHKYSYTYKYYGEKSGYAIIKYEVDYSEGVYGLKYPEVIEKKQIDLK